MTDDITQCNTITNYLFEWVDMELTRKDTANTTVIAAVGMDPRYVLRVDDKFFSIQYVGHDGFVGFVAG